jgi:hypothetical protein
VGIAYDIWDANWKTTNTIHVVWQASIPGPNGLRNEVFYANIPVANPPIQPAPWGMTSVVNLSNTPQTHSLVPTIAVNQNNHLHVAWQEEDINNNFGQLPLPQEEAWFSDIAYIRSVNGGVNWAGPGGGWQGNLWDNLTQTAANSQTPSIACILDQHTGLPHQLAINEFGYNSDDVHIAYSEDVNDPFNSINIFYLRSNNDGLNWNFPVNVTQATGGVPYEAYPSLAVDMMDNPHIAYMRNPQSRNEPLGPIYQPGISPNNPNAFPGPMVGMYNAWLSQIAYAYFNGANWITMMWGSGDTMEFPTVSLDRWQNVNVSW